MDELVQKEKASKHIGEGWNLNACTDFSDFYRVPKSSVRTVLPSACKGSEEYGDT